MKTIVPVIEGHSEVHSIGLLLRRVARERLLEEIAVERAIRIPRGRIVQEDEIARAIYLARRRPKCDGIVFLCDSDDDCPATLGPELSRIVQTQANPLPATFVFADREYEAWFLGAIESLRGRRGISPTAETPAHPERIRDAKGHLSR